MTVRQGRFTFTLLLTLFLLGCHLRTNHAAHTLLETYLDDITGLAGSPSAMLLALDQQESRLTSLKGQVPDAFIERYQRLLKTTRLVMAQKRNGEEAEQIAAFVQSVTGRKPAGGDNNLILAAAAAFSEEVLRLDMLLDGETDLNKVRARYAERLRVRGKT